MSKGTPIVTLRVAEKILESIDEAIERSRLKRFDGTWTRTQFIIAAITEKLDHMERGRKYKKRKNTDQGVTP